MKSADQAELLKYAEDIKYLLKKKGIRADTDCRMNYTPGWKFNHWEQKGFR
jgi:prolyl-tRNA synthetase